MNTIQVFKERVEKMHSLIKDKEKENIRVEVQGIKVRAIQQHKNNDGTLEIHGFDENEVETVLICPASHFSAKLTFVRKGDEPPFIGFQAI